MSAGNDIKPIPKNVMPAESEQVCAVINYNSPKQIDAQEAYRVNGQPVSKGK